MRDFDIINDFNEVRECDYKGEHYSVRDNGAVMRHARPGIRKRKLDNVWTFGNPNKQNGYMELNGHKVHRIVAFAFLGEPETDDMIVDHIDTNRQNNRPENLRWLTRLENVLKNPITRSKIEYRCGSIEAFLKDPTILKDYDSLGPNLSWMRTVTKEEGLACLEHMQKLSGKNSNSHGGQIGEWIFTPKLDSNSVNPKAAYWEQRKFADFHKDIDSEKQEQQEIELNNFVAKQAEDEKSTSHIEVIKSLTPNAFQVASWKTPTQFPQCPTNGTLQDYIANLKKGVVFSENRYNSHTVMVVALIDDGNAILIMTTSGEGQVKPWALSKVWQKNGAFIHESIGTYFHENGAMKQFTLLQGKEWTGGDVFNDFC